MVNVDCPGIKKVVSALISILSDYIMQVGEQFLDNGKGFIMTL